MNSNKNQSTKKTWESPVISEIFIEETEKPPGPPAESGELGS